METLEASIYKVLVKFENGVDLITADGGFDIKNYNGQEIVTGKLILCEIYAALKTQRENGTFIIKFFDMFTHNSIVYYLILSSFYQYVRIIKPKTSRKPKPIIVPTCEIIDDDDENFSIAIPIPLEFATDKKKINYFFILLQ
jgi:23S rRNA U2552 (ribose-2'-O)-methylase RlmE/FtsJ